MSQPDSLVLSPKSTTSVVPLLHVCIAAPVDGGVKSMQSKPTGQWYKTRAYFHYEIFFYM